MKKILYIISFSLSIYATPFWDFELVIEGGKRAESYRTAFERPSEMPEWRAFPRYSYPHKLVQLCEFWRVWQLNDPDSIEHGGIIEAESGELRDVIQTDNTQEVVWDWAYYIAHSGDSSYFANIDLAWIYLSNYPAYLEEIDPNTHYYRVWNSALGLLLEMGIRHMLGDSSKLGYADSCVDVVMFDRLSTTTIWREINGLHALVNGFSAGCLYLYGLDRHEPVWLDTALSLARQVQGWIDREPFFAMNYKNWAMSSGTILWGMLNSRFMAHPESLGGWLSIYGAMMPERFSPPAAYDPMIWDNSWNIWLANGFRAVWNATGDIEYYRKYREILDELLAQDTDNDGGIPPSAVGFEDEDMTWISAYILLYAMDWVIDSLPDVDAGALNPVIIMPKGYATREDTVLVCARFGNFGDEPLADVSAHITFDWGILLDTTVSLGWGEVFPPETIKVIPGSEGTHVITVRTNHPDDNPWNDTARVEFNVTAIRELIGAVRDSATHSPIRAKLFFNIVFADTSVLFDSIETDASGNLAISLPCLEYRIKVEPDFPYHGGDFIYFTMRDDVPNTLIIDLRPAQLLIVDDDRGANYERYFIDAIIEIGATYRIWDRDLDGTIPMDAGLSMCYKTVIWFTGDDSISTLDLSDLEMLERTIDLGGNVILTGQGICDDLAGMSRFNSLVQANWGGVSANPIVYGISGDPISGSFGTIVTFGSSYAAGNQRHRDKLIPFPEASGWLIYSDSSFAGVRFEDPISHGKMVFIGFGLEGVAWPGENPLFTNRTIILRSILNWFDPRYEIYEQPLPQRYRINIFPNPFNSTVSIDFSGAGANPSDSPVRIADFEIYDLLGGLVFRNPHGSPRERESSRGAPAPIIWRPDERLSSGIYLLKVKIKDEYYYEKLIYIK